MTLNRKQVDGRFIELYVGTGISCGDPVVKGDLTGVAISNSNENNGLVMIDTEGVYSLMVYGCYATGSSVSIKQGEKIYACMKDDQVELNKDSTNGKLFGYLLSRDIVTGTGAYVDVLLAR